MTEMIFSFPVLCISRRGFLSAVRERDALEICGQSALDAGYFVEMILIDSAGQSWQVRSVEKVANVGPFGGLRLLKSRRIRVRLDLAQGQRFDLAGLKTRVCEAIDQLPEQWEAQEDTTETKARVNGAASIPALIELFTEQL